LAASTFIQIEHFGAEHPGQLATGGIVSARTGRHSRLFLYKSIGTGIGQDRDKLVGAALDLDLARLPESQPGPVRIANPLAFIKRT